MPRTKTNPEPQVEAAPSVYPFTTPMVEGTPNADRERIKLYTLELPASVVGTFGVDPAFSIEGGANIGGFQRNLDERRATRIGKLMGGTPEEPPLPNIHGGLLAYAAPEDIEVSSDAYEVTLKRPLKLIDGQHRAAGAAWAAENGVVTDYTETVKVVVGASPYELSMWYLRTNIEARRVAPANIIVNVASMQGVVLKRKSWVARIAILLSSQEPFVIDGQRLVNFTPKDGGRISINTLYKVVDTLLPESLNKEGGQVEEQAFYHAQNALRLYAATLHEVWGQTEEDGTFKPSDAYGFTMLVAFARLHAALMEGNKDEAGIRANVYRAFDGGGLIHGTLPATFGSGERASTSLAAYMAGHIGLSPEKLAA